MKLTPASFRKGVNWIFLLLLYHFVAFLAYSFLVTNIVHSLVGLDGKSSAAYGVLVAFQCLYWLIVAFWAIFRGQMSYADVRRNIKTASKEEGFSAIQYFYQTFVKEWLWKTVIFVIFQLPFTVFYANFGLALDESITIIEKFYIVDSGFCAITGSAILGLVLSALFFLFAMLLVAYIGYRIVLKQR